MIFVGVSSNKIHPYTYYMGVSKNRGKNPKMDGENNGKPYEQMDDLGGKLTHYFRSSTHITCRVLQLREVTLHLASSCLD